MIGGRAVAGTVLGEDNASDGFGRYVDSVLVPQLAAPAAITIVELDGPHRAWRGQAWRNSWKSRTSSPARPTRSSRISSRPVNWSPSGATRLTRPARIGTPSIRSTLASPASTISSSSPRGHRLDTGHRERHVPGRDPLRRLEPEDPGVTHTAHATAAAFPGKPGSGRPVNRRISRKAGAGPAPAPEAQR